MHTLRLRFTTSRLARLSSLLRGFGIALMGSFLFSASGQGTRAATPATEAAELYRSSQQLIAQGHMAEAQSLLVRAHTLAPRSVAIAISLGKLDALIGKPQEAVALFRSVESIAPGNPENEVNLAIALATQGDLAAALVSADRALALAPTALPALHIRAKILAGLSRDAAAQADFEQAMKTGQADAGLLYDYAVFCEERGDLKREVSVLEQLIQRKPGTAQYHFLLGRAQQHLGETAAAQKELREAVRLDPDNRAALYLLSRALQKDSAAEAEAYGARFRALQVSQDELNALRDQGNAAVAAMSRGAWTQAIGILEATLERCAGCVLEADLQKDLGLAQCQNGDVAAGLAALHRALALNPRDAETLHAIQVAEALKPVR